MKLLFDNNLSVQLPNLLADIFPGSVHVAEAGLQMSSDIEIWNYAKAHDLVIVSKDRDFYYLSTMHGSPPKIIWLVLGNSRIHDTESALRTYEEEIIRFIDSSKDLLILKSN